MQYPYDDRPETLQRLPTDVPGLDRVLNGGFVAGGSYIIQGGPGAGKTILANQICFSWAARGGRALYLTLLAENHHRLLRFMRRMAFADDGYVGDAICYESCFDVLKSAGLEGVLRLVVNNAKARRSNLLVIDGLFVLEEVAGSEGKFREFVNDLSAFADLTGVTVLLLTNSKRSRSSPEYTMVDGWIELDSEELEYRTYRYLRVKKFRGSSHLTGKHCVTIDEQGFRVSPRLESIGRELAASAPESVGVRLSTGVEDLDRIVGGGIPQASNTVVVGPTGVGKTSLGLHFICQCTPQAPGLIFGFYESAVTLARRAASLGLDLQGLLGTGAVHVMTASPTECNPDELAQQLLATVREAGIARLFLDGIDALEQCHIYPQRLSPYLSALTDDLRGTDVTSLFTYEIPELLGGELAMNFTAISAITENILLFRYQDIESRLARTVSAIKMRGSGFDPFTYRFEVGPNGLSIIEPLGGHASDEDPRRG